jgi:PPOX class probable F420-dependent enzyme
VEIEKALEFVRNNNHAVLTTYFADGRAQMSPVTVGLDAENYVTISTREPAVKTLNLARDPRAVLCVFTKAFYGDWVLLEGLATIVHLPDALEPLVDYYRSVSGEHPDWEDYRAAMARERRVLLKIAITKAGPDRKG